MNDLNSQQIVLLTLLVSFVTSIATGITTVSLLERAPEPVTQTINRIVEKTVERVVPEESDDSEQENPVVVKPNPEKEVVTVVVNEEDLTIDAVEKNANSLVRILSSKGEFIALGLVIKNDGTIIADSQNIQPRTNYKLKYSSGEYDSDVVFRETNSPYALLKAKNVEEGKTFTSAQFSNSQNLKLAQSVISLSGRTKNTVSTGIVSGLYTEKGVTTEDSETETTAVDKILLIETSVNPANVLPGSLLINLKGEVVGMKIGSNLVDPTDFRPSSLIASFIAGI